MICALWFALLDITIAGRLHSPRPHGLAHNHIRLSANQTHTTNVTRSRNSTASAARTETTGPRASLLFAGIGANIDAQQGQLDSIQSIIALQATLQTQIQASNLTSAKNSTSASHRMRFNNSTSLATADATPYFLAAKQTLLAFTRASAQIRQANMFLANINPQVERGLAQLETEQVREYVLVNRLSGNQQADAATLQQLKDSVSLALQRNRALQEAVSNT